MITIFFLGDPGSSSLSESSQETMSWLDVIVTRKSSPSMTLLRVSARFTVSLLSPVCVTEEPVAASLPLLFAFVLPSSFCAAGFFSSIVTFFVSFFSPVVFSFPPPVAIFSDFLSPSFTFFPFVSSTLTSFATGCLVNEPALAFDLGALETGSTGFLLASVASVDSISEA